MRNPPTYLVRRRFLAGMGTLLALPVLDSLLPRSARAAAGTAVNNRLVLVHTSCGRQMGPFTPTSAGALNDLPTTLASLAKIKDRVLVLSNMRHDAADQSLKLSQNSSTGKHALGMGTLFTGAKLAASAQKSPTKTVVAVSMDQLYAATLANQTLPSLQLALPKNGNDPKNADDGFSGQTMRAIAYSDPNKPMDEQQNPREIFNNYFAGAATEEASAALTAQRTMRKSVLDNVLGQATSLKSKLSKEDGAKLDQYFTSVRALEKQFSAIPNLSCSKGAAPASIEPSDYQSQADAMMDLMALAFQCDLTRVITFNFGVGHSTNYYKFLDNNMKAGVHSLSHSNEAGGNREIFNQQKAKVEAWEIATLARFWNAIAAVTETSGTILDNSVSLVASEIADSNTHDYVNTGYLVVGKGGGFIDSGRHVVAGDPASKTNGNLTELQLAILQGLGVDAPTFGGFNTTRAMTLKV